MSIPSAEKTALHPGDQLFCDLDLQSGMQVRVDNVPGCGSEVLEITGKPYFATSSTNGLGLPERLVDVILEGEIRTIDPFLLGLESTYGRTIDADQQLQRTCFVTKLPSDEPKATLDTPDQVVAPDLIEKDDWSAGLTGKTYEGHPLPKPEQPPFHISPEIKALYPKTLAESDIRPGMRFQFSINESVVAGVFRTGFREWGPDIEDKDGKIRLLGRFVIATSPDDRVIYIADWVLGFGNSRRDQESHQPTQDDQICLALGIDQEMAATFIAEQFSRT